MKRNLLIFTLIVCPLLVQVMNSCSRTSTSGMDVKRKIASLATLDPVSITDEEKSELNFLKPIKEWVEANFYKDSSVSNLILDTKELLYQDFSHNLKEVIDEVQIDKIPGWIRYSIKKDSGLMKKLNQLNEDYEEELSDDIDHESLYDLLSYSLLVHLEKSRILTRYRSRPERKYYASKESFRFPAETESDSKYDGSCLPLTPVKHININKESGQVPVCIFDHLYEIDNEGFLLEDGEYMLASHFLNFTSKIPVVGRFIKDVYISDINKIYSLKSGEEETPYLLVWIGSPFYIQVPFLRRSLDYSSGIYIHNPDVFNKWDRLQFDFFESSVRDIRDVVVFKNQIFILPEIEHGEGNKPLVKPFYWYSHAGDGEFSFQKIEIAQEGHYFKIEGGELYLYGRGRKYTRKNDFALYDLFKLRYNEKNSKFVVDPQFSSSRLNKKQIINHFEKYHKEFSCKGVSQKRLTQKSIGMAGFNDGRRPISFLNKSFSLDDDSKLLADDSPYKNVTGVKKMFVYKKINRNPYLVLLLDPERRSGFWGMVDNVKGFFTGDKGLYFYNPDKIFNKWDKIQLKLLSKIYYHGYQGIQDITHYQGRIIIIPKLDSETTSIEYEDQYKPYLLFSRRSMWTDKVSFWKQTVNFNPSKFIYLNNKLYILSSGFNFKEPLNRAQKKTENVFLAEREKFPRKQIYKWISGTHPQAIDLNLTDKEYRLLENPFRVYKDDHCRKNLKRKTYGKK